MLDLNATLLFQLVNFLIAIFFLNMLLIKPIREIIKKRGDLMDEMAGAADHFHTEATNKLKEYEVELAKARREAGNNRELGKNEGLAELQAIVGKAQQSARDMLEENRKIIQGQAEAALTELRNGIDGFSEKLGRKLLG